MQSHLNDTNSMPALDMHSLTPHETPQQTFEKDPNIFISPVSILPPSAANPVIQDELPHLILTRSRPGAAADFSRHALTYVKCREPGSWELLESLASITHANITPHNKLKAAMKAGRNGGTSQAKEAYRNVERALGKWVVHEHQYNGNVYSPAAVETEVLANWAGRDGTAGLHEQFERNIDAFARREKTAYKLELDARKEALEGVLSIDHAKLVNNQKSAHLSKFMNVVATKAKDRLIAWLMGTKYGNNTNSYFFEQHMAM